MKRLLTASLFVLVSSTLAAAQTPSCKDWHSDEGWKLDQIDIAYVEPKDPAYSAIYDNLKQHKILEELQQFLSPLRLPDKVLIQTEQCDQPQSPYRPGGHVTLCYEYIAELAALAAKIPAGGTTPRGVSRDDAMVGAFVQTALNQMSHVIFDQQRIPVWGREDDAADKLAAFLMLQFPPETARKLVNGAAYFFEASERTWTGSDFADAQSPEIQRFYNYLCIAYGSDPQTFADFVAPSGQQSSGGSSQGRPDQLPARRVPWCPKEYNVVKYGFDIFIKPCLDQQRYETVHDRTNWPLWQDGE